MPCRRDEQVDGRRQASRIENFHEEVPACLRSHVFVTFTADQKHGNVEEVTRGKSDIGFDRDHSQWIERQRAARLEYGHDVTARPTVANK